jgi:hypothetical protein
VCTTKAILPSTCHPFGDFRFRRVLSASRYGDLIIPQLKYPHDDADVDINVIFPIERLQELGSEGVLGGLTENLQLQHGSDEVRPFGCSRRRVARSGVTDLPSVRWTDPARDRGPRHPNGVNHRRQGPYRKD